MSHQQYYRCNEKKQHCQDSIEAINVNERHISIFMSRCTEEKSPGKSTQQFNHSF
jgi:hypothetical protein